MRPLVRCAVAVLALSLLALSADAQRRRAVSMPLHLTAGLESEVSARDVLPGAAGRPLAIASRNDATAVAWVSIDSDQLYAGVWSGDVFTPPFGALLPTSGYRRQVKIASNARDFVVAWLVEGGIRVGVLRADGMPESSLIPADAIADSLQLVSDGDGYLVAWRSAEQGERNAHLHGQRLDAQARAILQPFDLAPGSCVNQGLLAGGAGRFLLALALAHCDGLPAEQLQVRTIASDGTLGHVEKLGQGSFIWQSALTSNGVDFFVTWVASVSSATRISRISPSGRVEATVVSELAHSVVGAPGRTVLLRYAGPSSLAMIQAVRLNDELQPAGEAVDLAQAAYSAISTTAGDIQLIRTAVCDDCTDILHRGRWSVDTLELKEAGPVFSRLRDQRRTGVVRSGERYVVTWDEERDDGNGRRVVYTVGDEEGWSMPVPVSDAATQQRQPSIAAASGVVAIVWEESQARTFPAVNARMIRDDGTSTLVRVADAGAYPTIASNGSSFVVAWTSNARHLQTRQVSRDGSANIPHDISSDLRTISPAALAPRPGGYLMLYDSATAWGKTVFSYSLTQQFLDPAGAPVGSALAIDPSSFSSHGVAVASTGAVAYALFSRSGALSASGEAPDGLHVQQVVPGVAPASRVTARSTSARTLSPYRGGFLAAWIHGQEAVVSSIYPAGLSSPATVSSNALPHSGLGVASRSDDAIVVYVRRFGAEGFGGSGRIVYRLVR